MKYILDAATNKYYIKNKIPAKVRVKSQFSKKKSKIIWKKDGSAEGVAIEDYEGSVKPLIIYRDLNKIHPLSDICVVGIDLVSSEERETGYCILKGHTAEVCRINTDEEMIQLAMDNNVDLVSIDSPLSIPRGRTSYFDDDPYREKYGITRLCERILKRRGINSYPCLIPSMQKLTQRGMELAKKFRVLGVPVIESYPGAAQDIMSIPRKQAGLKYLKDGIAEFGIEGKFIEEDVSHDELDAITSAIVGHFFWTGMYEGLGDEEEDYLIIPDLNANTKKWLRRKVVGLSGGIASGKTTISAYLKTKGYSDTRYSKVLESILVKEGKDVNRSNLQRLGREVNEGKGQRWLGGKVVETIEREKMAVVDGIRFLEDRSFMMESFGPTYVHLHVKADEEVRLKRVINRSGEDIPLNEALKSKTEQEISLLEGVADAVIENNSSLADLYGKLDKFLEGI